MRLCIIGGSAMTQNFSFIAPMRIARAARRAGDSVKMIEWLDNRLKGIVKFGEQEHKWGISYTLPVCSVMDCLKKTIESWKPDLIYSMGTSFSEELSNICLGYNIPLVIHIGDPYYASYPSDGVVSFYKKASFITFNEGQAWNYIRNKYSDLTDRCYLLNHAIDPELSPTLEEVEKTDKEYICSIVGGDDRIRRRELLVYMYQWTDMFPEYKFATGGSLTKGVNEEYKESDLTPSINEGMNEWNHTTFNEEEVDKFKNRKFNIKFIPNDLPYPLGLSHKTVHNLYSKSYYGFTPYGSYLRKGWQSEYNTMTFGTKIFEMGGSGCGMIANRIKDIEVVIKHGETGFILDKPEDGYEVFKLAVEKPEEIRQIGINAYKFIHEYHSWDIRYREVLQSIYRKLGIK